MAGIQADIRMIEQLKQDRAKLTEILQSHTTEQTHTNIGQKITLAIYIQILHDALSTINSLINHLEKDHET